MASLRLVVIFTTLAMVSSASFAEKREIWHGWADALVPCSKEFVYKDDLGISWSSLRSAPQQHHTRIYLDLPTWDDSVAKAQECGLTSAGVSGAAAFLASPASAWPAFVATFKVCAAQKGIAEVSDDMLSVTSNFECKW